MPTNSLKNFSISLTNDLMSTLTFSTAWETAKTHFIPKIKTWKQKSHTFHQQYIDLSLLNDNNNKKHKNIFHDTNKIYLLVERITRHTLSYYIFISYYEDLLPRFPIILTSDDMTEQIKIFWLDRMQLI